MDEKKLDKDINVRSKNDMLSKVTEWLSTKAKTNDDMYYVGVIAGTFLAVERQKAEIERLTEEKSFAIRKMMESKAKTVELQEQVDELTRKNQAFEKVIDSYENGEVSAKTVANAITRYYEPIAKEFKEQAVKDTAKEIFAEWENNLDDYIDFADFIDKMKARYGVEVE